MRVMGLIGALPVPDTQLEATRPVALLRALADAGDDVTLLVGTALSAPQRATLADASGATVGAPGEAAGARVPASVRRWLFGARIAGDARSPLAGAARARLATSDTVISFDAAGHGVASALADDIPTLMDVVALEGLTDSGDWAHTSADRWRLQPRRSWERRVLARAMALTTDTEVLVEPTFRLYYRRPTVVTTPGTAGAAAPSVAETLHALAADATVRLADINSGRVPTPPADPAALKAEVLDALATARDSSRSS